MPILELEQLELPERPVSETYTKIDPSFSEVVKATFNTSLAGESIDALTRFVSPDVYEKDPSYDVAQDLSGYEEYASSFSNVTSKREAFDIKQRIDKDLKDRQTIANGDVLENIGALALTAPLDPLSYVPFAGAVGKTGRILEGAAKNAGMMLVAGSAEELALQRMQEVRTKGESIGNITAMTFVGGLLGGAMAHLESGKTIQSIAKAVDDDLTVPTDVYEKGSVGAAAVKETTFEQEGIVSALGVEKALKFNDPVLAGMNSPSKYVRKITNEIAETALYKNKNIEGIASDISVENLVKQYEVPRYTFLKKFDDLYSTYRFGDTTGVAKKIIRGAYDMTGAAGRAGKMTKAEFGEAVIKAARREDVSDIAEVAAAARALRADVFDPILKKAVAAGMFEEGELGVKTAASYVSRIWDKGKILADLPKFKEINYRWLVKKRDEAALKMNDMYKKLEYIGDEKEFQSLSGEIKQSLNKYTSKALSMYTKLDKVSSDVFSIDKTISALRIQKARLVDIFVNAKVSSRMIDDLNKQLKDNIYLRNKYLEEINILDATPKAIQGIDDSLKILHDQQQRILSLTNKTKENNATFLALNRKKEQLYDKRSKLISKLRSAEYKSPRIKEINDSIENIRNRITKAREEASKFKGDSSTLDAINGRLQKLQLKRSMSLDEIRITKDAIENFSKKISSNEVGQRYIEAALNKIREINDEIEQIRPKVLMENAELLQVTDELVDRIKGGPARLAYEYEMGDKFNGFYGPPKAGLRGPAKSRVYDIPDEMVEDFIVNDPDQIVSHYTRSLGTDIELLRKFGTVDPTKIKKEIQSDYQKLTHGADAATQRKLEKLKDRDLTNVDALWQKLRGTYGVSNDTFGINLRKVEGIASAFNYTTMLGGMTLSAFTDIAMPIMKQGMGSVYKYGIKSIVRDYKSFMKATEGVKEAGTALDMVLATTSRSVAGMDEFIGGLSRTQQTLGKMSDVMSVASLMAPWNAAMKQFTGVIVQSRILDATTKIAKGEKLDKAITTNLASNFIDNDMAKRIADQFKKYGEKSNDVLLANSKVWDDAVAREAFDAAIRREVDYTIVTPGLSRPLWMSRPGLRLIGQFKSFAFSSVQQTLLVGLQRRDASTFVGMSLATFLGMGVYGAKSVNAGRDVSDDWRVWVKEGVDRSGLLGWFFDANNIVEKATRGKIGVSSAIGGPLMSRYASRSAAEAMLGPTYGQITNLIKGVGAAAAGDWSAADTTAIRKLIPFQNLLGVSHVFNQVERSFNESIGVKNR